MVRKAIPLLLLALAGCGYKGDITRIDMNRTDVPKAKLKEMKEAEGEAARDALTLSPQERPVRVDDIVTRPSERPDDMFNLPPK